MTDNRDKIIDKIQKLLALATSPNEHEAAAAAAKAQELLLNYKLTMADIEGADVNLREPVEEYHMPMGVNQWRTHAWCDMLVGSVAKVTFCNVLQHTKSRQYILVGKATDVAVAREMYWFLLHQCERLALEYMRDMHRKDEKAKTGFLLGCATRVGYRVREAFELQRRSNSKVDALMIVESNAVQEFMKKRFPDAKEGREHRGPNDYASYAHGIEAGDRVRLKREGQLHQTEQKRLRSRLPYSITCVRMQTGRMFRFSDPNEQGVNFETMQLNEFKGYLEHFFDESEIDSLVQDAIELGSVEA